MSRSDEIQLQIKGLLDSRLELLRIQKNHVYVNVKEKMLTGERGHLILDTEKSLRREVGLPLEVFLEPRGDMNKLRLELRGVSALSIQGESRDAVFDERYRGNSSAETQKEEN